MPVGTVWRFLYDTYFQQSQPRGNGNLGPTEVFWIPKQTPNISLKCGGFINKKRNAWPIAMNSLSRIDLSALCPKTERSRRFRFDL